MINLKKIKKRLNDRSNQLEKTINYKLTTRDSFMFSSEMRRKPF